jgi:hypothetical protein
MRASAGSRALILCFRVPLLNGCTFLPPHSTARNWVNVPATNWSSSCLRRAAMVRHPGQNTVSCRLGLNKRCCRKESKAVSRMRTVQVCDSLFSNPLPRQRLASGSFTKHALCPARTGGRKLVVLDCLIQQIIILIFAYFMLYPQTPFD